MAIVLLLVVVVAAVAVVAAAAAASGRDRATTHSLLGGAGPPLILLGGVGAAVVLGSAVAVTVGFRGGGPEEERATTPPPTAPAAAEAAEPASASPNDEPVPRPVVPAGTGPEVKIRAGGSPIVIDRLPDHTVMVVNATGFRPGTGEVAQCGPGTEGPGDCRNRFPIEFGAEGAARFQYLVSDRVHEGERCGAGQQPCLLVVFGSHGEGEGRAFTVFHDPAPPAGRVTVAPTAGLSDGDVATVTATGFPPATRLLTAQCPLDTGVVPGACRSADATRTGPDGTAVIRLTIRTGEVDGVVCGPRRPCSIQVTAEAPIAPVSRVITFSAAQSARYHGAKLAAGLVLAVLLLALAWRLLRTTDWREPAAAATPEMDRAVFEPDPFDA